MKIKMSFPAVKIGSEFTPSHLSVCPSHLKKASSTVWKLKKKITNIPYLVVRRRLASGADIRYVALKSRADAKKTYGPLSAFLRRIR